MNIKSSQDIGEFVNIGISTDLTIHELEELIKIIVGFSGDIVWDDTKLDGTLQKLFDVSMIERLGLKAKAGLSKGISILYANYQNIQLDLNKAVFGDSEPLWVN